jgi:long-chain acyl-CoA synthetase
MAGDLLLTGATGFVGMELLGRYLERGERRVIVPVRAGDDAAAAVRLEEVLHGMFGPRADRYRRRVDPVAADLTVDGLGLSRRRREAIAERVDQIVHCAASVSFALPLDEARRINVEGTRHMLELATLAQDRGGLRRFGHVSTAYVSGTHQGKFHEHDHDVGQEFRNSYEQSKFEAERLVRSRRDLPVTVLRPSIVVGDRRSGWTAAFNVLYWPLRAFARGLFPAVPAVPSAPVDVVSVDFVADAIHALCETEEGVGETYHLTAAPMSSSVAEIAELASRYFDRPPPRVLDPAAFARYAARLPSGHTNALSQSEVYFPYFAVCTEFDNSRARARLGPAGITASPLAAYLERLLDFATRTRWGKRPVSRLEALSA